jgi:FkbM family methyltransferase
MFDLGANFGYYAIAIASKLRGNCRIYAFEPNPPTMRRFRRNIELNSIRGVFPQDAGLSDAPGYAQVVDRSGNSGASYLDKTLAAPAGSPRIPITTLDSFIEHHPIDRLDLIKMDIEGAELRALQGGAETLRTFKPAILIELNPGTYQREGYSVGDVMVFLEDLGYEIFTIKPRARVTRDHLPAQCAIVNAVCRPIPGRLPPPQSISHRPSVPTS